MSPLAAFGIGFGVAALVAVAIVVPLLRRVEHRARERARDAERRAKDAERLAELGSMTRGLAHEIKNPLSTILLNAQLLREGITDAGLPEEEEGRLVRRLDSLSRECERLRGILEDFLQFAGRIHLSREPVDLGQLLEEMTDFFLPQASAAGVRQRVQRPDAPVTGAVDPRLFKQALLNLMINAVQAMSEHHAEGDDVSPTGLELMLRLDVDDPEAVRMHVIDTGPGVPDDLRESIFHPYVTKKRGGTGLGLPTARRIVEEHGGTLTVISELGRGSDFVITLPVDALAPPPDEGLEPDVAAAPADEPASTEELQFPGRAG
ncbi:MAG: PAS domain-containing sensor histidine kinase [Phycisphaerales bacterium]